MSVLSGDFLDFFSVFVSEAFVVINSPYGFPIF